MKNLIPIISLGLILALSGCKQCNGPADVTDLRVDLGQLKVIEDGTGNSYCVYKVTANDNPDAAFYQNGDKVCIKCCEDPQWPEPDPRELIKCPRQVKFTSSDGEVEYDMELIRREENVCKDCAEARGYYDCPDDD